MNSTETLSTSKSSTGRAESNGNLDLRRELVDAQVGLLRMYLEKKSPQQFLAAVERLMACTRASFGEEEALMESLGGQLDPAHRERHSKVMAELESLRASVLGLDRGSLLARLILVDRGLITHISNAGKSPAQRQRPHQPEFADASLRVAEQQH